MALEIFYLGHEETHLLQRTGNLHLFFELLRGDNLELSFASHNDEIVANFGGIYAMFNRGYDFNSFDKLADELSESVMHFSSAVMCKELGSIPIQLR